MLHALRREQIEVPRRPGEIVEAMMDAEWDRLEGRMNRERHIEVLSGGEQTIVIGMPMRLARDGERRDECAFASVFDGAFEFLRRGVRIAEREMRDGNQPSAGVAAEIRDPSIVGATVGVREFGVEELG